MSDDTIKLYLFEIVNESEGIGIFTKEITQSRIDPLPKHYSLFAPPNVPRGLNDVYFDGCGWTTGPALDTITSEMISNALKLKYAKQYAFEIQRLNEMQKLTTPVDHEVFEYMGQAALQYVSGNELLFRMVLASEQKINASIEDARNLDDAEVSREVQTFLAKYNYTLIRRATITGNYRRLCRQAAEEATSLRIVKELLHGHN